VLGIGAVKPNPNPHEQNIRSVKLQDTTATQPAVLRARVWALLYMPDWPIRASSLRSAEALAQATRLCRAVSSAVPVGQTPSHPHIQQLSDTDLEIIQFNDLWGRA